MDTNTLLATVLVAFLANLPAAITAWAAYRQGKRTAVALTNTTLTVAKIERKADEIQTQTNGHLSKVTEQLDKAHERIGTVIERLTTQAERAPRRASDVDPDRRKE